MPLTREFYTGYLSEICTLIEGSLPEFPRGINGLRAALKTITYGTNTSNSLHGMSGSSQIQKQ